MVKRYKDISSSASASITTHKDGTATLRIMVAGRRKSKKYASAKSAYNAWWRMCN